MKNNFFKKELGFLLITTVICFFSVQINHAMEKDQKTGLTTKLNPAQEKELFLSLVNNVKIEGVTTNNATLDTEKAAKLMTDWKVSPDYIFTTIGEKNGDKTYIINFTIRNGLISFLKKLIEKKANINIKDHFGSTPLHYAASLSPEVLQNKFIIIEALVTLGADKNAKNIAGKMPIDLLKNPSIYSNPYNKLEEEKVYNYLKHGLVTLPAPTEPKNKLEELDIINTLTFCQ